MFCKCRVHTEYALYSVYHLLHSLHLVSKLQLITIKKFPSYLSSSDCPRVALKILTYEISDRFHFSGDQSDMAGSNLEFE